MSTPDSMAALREHMVRTQIARRDVRDPAVLAAMQAVPRHLFLPERLRFAAYADGPVDIGYGQTISQPYIVALMTQALGLVAGDRVLDVGTGSGYQPAVLAELGCEVYSIEIVKPLAQRARELLAELGYAHAHLRTGDGTLGWPDAAPFDGIVVAAAPDAVPRELERQLRVGGRLVIPVGNTWHQDLMVIERTGHEAWRRTTILPVLFVPMTGAARGGAGP